MQESNCNLFIISLGSNLTHEIAEEKLQKAEIFLSSLLGPDLKFSSHYTTEGVGSGLGKQYLNSVCLGYTSLDCFQIKAALKEFEVFTGRSPETRKQGIVPIDLDLLQLGDEVYKKKDLSMDYVIKGLNEIR